MSGARVDEQAIADRLAELKLRVLREKINAVSSAQQQQFNAPSAAMQPPPQYYPLPPPPPADHEAFAAAAAEAAMLQQLQMSLQAQTEQLEAAVRQREQLRRRMEAAHAQDRRADADAQMRQYQVGGNAPLALVSPPPILLYKENSVN
jgi:hypothetical protein